MLNNLLNLYKKHRYKTPLEDFTTEVFAGLLNMEQEIKNNFIHKFLKLPEDKYSVKTQGRYSLENDTNCIVDIVIEGVNAICFIENKVNSTEGDRQLERYGKVLDTKKNQDKQTYLFYCTKYYDEKDCDFHQFRQLRWFEIASFMKEYEQNSFVKQFINFLEKQDMAQELTFEAKDFISLNNLQNIINITYGYLDRVKPIFREKFRINQEPCNGFDIYQIRTNNRLIYYYKEILSGPDSWSEIGYGFSFDKPEIKVWIWVDRSNEQFEKCEKLIEKSEFEVKVVDEKGALVELKKDLSVFLNDEEADNEIQKWFVDAFEKFIWFVDETKTKLDWKIGIS